MEEHFISVKLKKKEGKFGLYSIYSTFIALSPNFIEEYESVDLLPCEYDEITELEPGHYLVKKGPFSGLVYAGNNCVYRHLETCWDSIESTGGGIYKMNRDNNHKFLYAYKTASFRALPDGEKITLPGNFEFKKYLVQKTGLYFWCLYESDILLENRYLFKEVQKDEKSECYRGTKFDGSEWHLLIIHNKPRCMRKV